MSDIFTRIRLPGAFDGRTSSILGMQLGRNTPAKMISSVRERAERIKKESEEILAAPDSAFKVDIVRGSCVMHHVKELQKSDRN